MFQQPKRKRLVNFDMVFLFSCRFRIDNTDHIIDVNQGRSPATVHHDYDKVNIICPLYDKTDNFTDGQIEKFLIYHVSKEEYDSCRIMSPHPKIVATCDAPFSLRVFTLSFRTFSPTPGALEFHPGKDYYFVSTSSKNDLHNRLRGLCYTHNMKVVFKVAPLIDPSAKEPETTTKFRPGMISDILEESNNEIHDNDDTVGEFGAKPDETKKKKKNKGRRGRRKGRKSHKKDQKKVKEQEPSQVQKVKDLMNQQEPLGAAYSPSLPSSSSSSVLHWKLCTLLVILCSRNLFLLGTNH